MIVGFWTKERRSTKNEREVMYRHDPRMGSFGGRGKLVTGGGMSGRPKTRRRV